MRSFPIVAIALATAAPALAYPSGSYAASYAKRDDHLVTRELVNVLARSEYDTLFARSFGSDFWSGFKKGFTGTLKAALPFATALLRREDVDILARAAFIAHLDSRDEMDLLARGEADGLYARNDFWDGFKKGFTGTLKAALPFAPALLALREDTELLTRSERDLLAREFSYAARSLNELD